MALTPFQFFAVLPWVARWYSSQRVGLAAAKLRGEIEHGGRLDLDARQTADDLRSEVFEVGRQEPSLEELVRLAVDGRSTAVRALLEQMPSELSA